MKKGEIKLYDLTPIYSSFLHRMAAEVLHQDYVNRICSRPQLSNSELQFWEKSHKSAVDFVLNK